MQVRFGSFCKALTPVITMALAATLSGCDAKVTVDGMEGKKLSELDLSGTPPEKLVLAGPDHVRIAEGPRLAITVDGDPQLAEHLRFTLKDGTLGILREKSWNKGALTVNVTMPAPKDLTLAGSGTIESAALGHGASVTVAGSGDVRTGTLSGDTLKINVAGSGTVSGGGAVRDLDMTIAGSGNAELAALRADHAKVTIAGSGTATMTSDGDVDATILGSGTVRVKGRARCKVSSMGSGKLVCESDNGQAAASSAPSGSTGAQ